MLKGSQRTLLLGLSLLFVITFACGLVYLVNQQSLRLGANAEPNRLATETINRLETGINANDAVPASKVDITKSLEPFVMVFDQKMNLVATSGLMGTIPPVTPENKQSIFNNVLNWVDQNGESRLTWQPDKTNENMRFAMVSMKYNGGYVVAAQSLKEPEKLIEDLGRLILFAWIGGVAFAEICLWLISSAMKKSNAKEQQQ